MGTSYTPAAATGASTVIARGVKVEGDFASEGDVVIEGQVNGNLSTSSILTVGPEAHIKADVKAREATISGTVDGNMTIASRLHLQSTAKVNGDIAAETIEVESGAQIQGKVLIGVKPTMKIEPQMNAGRFRAKTEPMMAKVAEE